MRDQKIPKKFDCILSNRKFNIADKVGVELNLNFDNVTTWKAQLYNVIIFLHQESALISLQQALNSESRLYYKLLTHNIYLTAKLFKALSIAKQSVDKSKMGAITSEL